MASRAHLRRTTSTPPPGGDGGDGSPGSDDDLSRTSEVTGDQGRTARDESDESVSPRARELYCTEEWVGGLPRLLYPGGDLCVYDDEPRRRYVIIRKLTLAGGVGRKRVVTYATDRYDPDDREDKEAKEEDVLEAWLHSDQLDRYAATDLEAYAARVAREDTPELEVEDPQECIAAIEAAYDDFDEAARRKLREAVLKRLREDFPRHYATNRAGDRISLEDLADYVMDPKKDALWLGNEDYEDLARAGFKSGSHRGRHGRFLEYIKTKFKKKSQLYLRMITCAYAHHGLSRATLKKLAEFFQTDHLHSTLCDDPVLSRVLLLFNFRNNFFLLFKTLNTALNFESWANFKKEYTGDAWFGVIYFVRRAIELETRLYPAA